MCLFGLIINSYEQKAAACEFLRREHGFSQIDAARISGDLAVKIQANTAVYRAARQAFENNLGTTSSFPTRFSAHKALDASLREARTTGSNPSQPGDSLRPDFMRHSGR